jgi:predicted DNA-binding transcriptional regulator AlpA
LGTGQIGGIMLQTIERSRAETSQPSGDDDILLTSNQTRARVGNVSQMCIWRWLRDDRVRFPQPIQINRRNYWRLGDLRQWQAERTGRAA